MNSKQIYASLVKHVGHKVEVRGRKKMDEDGRAYSDAEIHCVTCNEAIHEVPGNHCGGPMDWSYARVVGHCGHGLEVAGYGREDEGFVNVAVECMDCYEVLVDADRESDEDEVPEIVFEGPDVCLRGQVRVEWDCLGEGLLGGEYNEDDPQDVDVLRFYVMHMNEEGEWVEVDDGSYCTQVPSDADESVLQAGLRKIMNDVYDDVVAERSIKKTCETLSWMSPEQLNLSDKNVKGGDAA